MKIDVEVTTRVKFEINREAFLDEDFQESYISSINSSAPSTIDGSPEDEVIQYHVNRLAEFFADGYGENEFIEGYGNLKEEGFIVPRSLRTEITEVSDNKV